MRDTPPPPGDLEPVADLDALDGLDAHDRLGEERIEFAVPVDVAAEADRHTEAEHLDHAAERVAVLGRSLDLGDHRLAGGEIEAAHLVVVDPIELIGRGTRSAGGHPDIAHLDDVRDDVDAQRLQQRLGDRTGGDASSGLAGTRRARARRGHR